SVAGQRSPRGDPASVGRYGSQNQNGLVERFAEPGTVALDAINTPRFLGMRVIPQAKKYLSTQAESWLRSFDPRNLSRRRTSVERPRPNPWLSRGVWNLDRNLLPVA